MKSMSWYSNTLALLIVLILVSLYIHNIYNFIVIYFDYKGGKLGTILKDNVEYWLFARLVPNGLHALISCNIPG